MSKRIPDYRTENKMVVRNDYVYADHPTGMSIYAMRLLRLAITQCRKSDKEFYEYEFNVSDLADMIGCDKSNLYRVADEATDMLLRVLLKTGKMDGKSRGRKHPVFYKCEYESGKVILQLHPDMEELFLNLRQNFTQIPIAPLLIMQSKYGIRVFEMMCQKMMNCFPYADHATSIDVSLEEVRAVTGTEKQKTYDKISNLKSKVLLSALKDIETAAGWKIILSDIKRSRKITGFRLEVWSASGYAYIEKCKSEGRLPEQDDNIPGQMSFFDLNM